MSKLISFKEYSKQISEINNFIVFMDCLLLRILYEQEYYKSEITENDYNDDDSLNLSFIFFYPSA